MLLKKICIYNVGVTQRKSTCIIHRICSVCDVQEDADLADIYAAYRNQTAHGVIRLLENCDVATYRMLSGFIFVTNLKKSEYSCR